MSVLLLNSRQSKLLALATLDRVPHIQRLLQVPGQQADPRLNVVTQLEHDIVGLGDLAAGVGDLVLGLLVLKLENSAVSRTS